MPISALQDVDFVWFRDPMEYFRSYLQADLGMDGHVITRRHDCVNTAFNATITISPYYACVEKATRSGSFVEAFFGYALNVDVFIS